MAVPTELYPLMLRKYTWDLLPCNSVQRFMPILGLVPASEEGAEIEHKESHKRIALQEPLQDKLQVYSAMTATVLAALALALDRGPEPPNIVQMVTSQFTQTIHVGSSAIIANLIDQGYLQLGPKMELEVIKSE